MIVSGLGASVFRVAKLANCDGPLCVCVAPTSTLRSLKPWPARAAASAISPPGAANRSTETSASLRPPLRRTSADACSRVWTPVPIRSARVQPPSA